MRILWKAFLLGIALQLFLVFCLWFTGRAAPDSAIDLVNGFLAVLAYLFYLIPIAFAGSLIFGNDAISAPVYLILALTLGLFYAAFMSFAFSALSTLKNARPVSLK